MSRADDMVERCAVAVKAKLFEMQHRTDTMGFEEIAVAVIEALMEPTQKMMENGWNAVSSSGRVEPGPDNTDILAVYQAMLRTALSQPNDEGDGK